ncbi:MAG: DUF5339 family protein [Lonepinella koalarum]|nr:DUF5339 family protein [Lonepinella koalarum]
MKKVLLSMAALMAAFSVNAADLHPACEAYYKQVDEYVKNAPAQVKQQMEQSKEQFKAVPKESQEQICKQASEQLKQMPKM